MKTACVYLALLATLGTALPKDSRVSSQHDNLVEFETGAVSRAMSEFSQAIYLDLAEANQGNFVFSPLSLHSALTMLYLGTTTGSQTEHQLKLALGGLQNKEHIKAGFKKIIDTYKPELNFLYGNNFWVQEGIEIKESFKKMIKTNLNSGIDSINFSSPNSTDVVNDWVSNMTNGKIDKLVESFSGNTALFLANALYFKEDWKVPFEDTTFTEEPLFGEFLTGKGKVDVPMIQQILTTPEVTFGQIKVYGSEVVNVVSIPYKNDLFEMQIFTPEPSSSKSGFEQLSLLEYKMNETQTRDVTSEQDSYFNLFSHTRNTTQYDVIYDEVFLKMPTFQVSSELDVVEPLRKLGAERVFTTGAELGELASGSAPFSVSKITHKAVVEVTKTGTEGAAATGAEIVLLSASFSERKDVIVDRPFIFVVQDKRNNIPVLVGRVMDPSIKTP